MWAKTFWAAADSPELRIALCLLFSMSRLALRPNRVSCNATIAVCESAGATELQSQASDREKQPACFRNEGNVLVRCKFAASQGVGAIAVASEPVGCVWDALSTTSAVNVCADWRSQIDNCWRDPTFQM